MVIDFEKSAVLHGVLFPPANKKIKTWLLEYHVRNHMLFEKVAGKELTSGS
jgi:hypothetical protein